MFENQTDNSIKTAGLINQRIEKGSFLNIYDVTWIKNIESILKDENTKSLIIYQPRQTFDDRHANYIDNIYLNDEGLSNHIELTPLTFINDIIEKLEINPNYSARLNIFVNSDKVKKYEDYCDIACQISNLYHYYPIYKNIVIPKDDSIEIKTLIDLIFTLPKDERELTLKKIKFAKSSTKNLKNIAENVLKQLNVDKTFDLLTQEEQIEAFIEFSKKNTNQVKEHVSDEQIEVIKNSDSYKNAIQKLTDHGFKLSKTQQFNVLQSSGLLNVNRTLYNMSDMGAGKTLMTVESIYLLDLNCITWMTNLTSKEMKRLTSNKNVTINVPDKHLIAPSLSIKSSWLDTFKIFYDVKQINDSKYELSFTYKDLTFKSILNICDFTVKNGLKINHKLPIANKNDYLIVDEIHQLANIKTLKNRFFDKSVDVDETYKKFILSGTLSNLTTDEWFNIIKFIEPKLKDNTLYYSSSKLKATIHRLNAELRDRITKSVQTIESLQHRTFDEEHVTLDQTKIKRQNNTYQKNYFDAKYAPKLLNLYKSEDVNISSELHDQQYLMKCDPNVISAPNFELFYSLVGDCAITAESIQVAEELFGKQKTQHKAQVIRTKSDMSSKDIELLKVLHKIANDYNIYKSQLIGTKINNAILNLNDGLSKKNLYDILSHHANTNTKFLKYLTTCDLDVLTDLQKSKLIDTPKLTDTVKFKALQKILNDEPNETYLIVVNDFEASKTLANALDIEYITRQQLSDPINYQDVLDSLFDKQNIVVVPQMMIKSSLDLVKANRLIQYQLNTEISDIIQTQNRINRIGQTRETKAFYIATDQLQENIIELFLGSYKNIKVAHKGIIELFVDINKQINVVNDYIDKAIKNI